MLCFNIVVIVPSSPSVSLSLLPPHRIRSSFAREKQKKYIINDILTHKHTRWMTRVTLCASMIRNKVAKNTRFSLFSRFLFRSTHEPPRIDDIFVSIDKNVSSKCFFFRCFHSNHHEIHQMDRTYWKWYTAHTMREKRKRSFVVLYLVLLFHRTAMVDNEVVSRIEKQVHALLFFLLLLLLQTSRTWYSCVRVCSCVCVQLCARVNTACHESSLASKAQTVIVRCLFGLFFFGALMCMCI